MGKRKGGTSIEEINDWARRMIDDVEDFDYADTAEEWQDFLISKGIGNPKGLAALERGRDSIMEFAEIIDIDHDIDKRGQAHLREEFGRFVARDAVKTRIKSIRKGMEEFSPRRQGE